MATELTIFDQYPAREIPKRNMPAVSVYHDQGMAVAGPLFEAGVTTVCLAQNKEYQSRYHCIGEHRFILLVRGRMEIRMGKKTVTAEPGDLVCTPVGTMTQRTGLEPVEWIYISIDDVPLWSPLKKAGPTIRQYDSAGLMYILTKKIIGALRSHDLYSIRCAYENSEMLLTLLERELRHYSDQWKPKRMDKIIDLLDRIRKDPAYAWSRTTMAREIGMSERNLTIIFNRVYGISPGKMLIRIRMEHAMMMLRGSQEDSVEDIGTAIGYRSLVAFSRAFKNYMGMSPASYRKKYLE